MQRIQKLLVITAAASAAIVALSLAGCGKVGEKVPSAADYLHDIDAARAKVKEYQGDPAKLQNDAAVINASQAVAKLGSDRVLQCWGKTSAERHVATANTNHECLDAQGFKR
ncbi:hypothetical protein [Caenimonas koreensis]|uniref:hypothetical protein n=1 Tax=Caenimonas koreensis TaxID=367474 RepID=UPI001E5978BA|nr:hypothetical protein [Caenimonas koreensis]